MQGTGTAEGCSVRGIGVRRGLALALELQGPGQFAPLAVVGHLDGYVS